MLNNGTPVPRTNPKDMSPDLRARFRYDIRQGMSYVDLQEKYNVFAQHISSEKLILGIPLNGRGKKSKGRRRVNGSTTTSAPLAQRVVSQIAPAAPSAQVTASAELSAADVAKKLRAAVTWLTKRGYSITISGDAVEIVRKEVL